MRAGGDPVALALRAKYKQVVMPSLDLGPADAAVLIDYIDSKAARCATPRERRERLRPAQTTAGVNMKPIVDPYLRIQQALHADTLGDGINDARSIAAEAAKLGSGGAAIEAAAGEFQKAADLAAARAAFARLGDAIMAYAKASGASVGSDVKVAYCPMVQKSWLQKGETIQNPFYGKAMSDCGRINAGLPDVKD